MRLNIKKFGLSLLGVSILSIPAFAGEWCPPEKGGGVYESEECYDDCPDVGGSISVGYDTDYVWRGVRWARDSMWGDVNYTFANLPLSPNIGVWHLTSLGSGGGVADAYGDETNVYAGISLPSLLGFDTSLGYTGVFFPTFREPSPGTNGDSSSRLTFGAERELFGGLGFGYAANYDFGASGLGSWFHEFALSKSFALTDAIGLDLTAATAYNDGYWSGYGFAPISGFGGYGSGFNHYNISAALPIALNCRATLTPYIAYNGTPNGWIADRLNGGVPGGNANDVLYGGISLGVDF